MPRRDQVQCSMLIRRRMVRMTFVYRRCYLLMLCNVFFRSHLSLNSYSRTRVLKRLIVDGILSAVRFLAQTLHVVKIVGLNVNFRVART